MRRNVTAGACLLMSFLSLMGPVLGQPTATKPPRRLGPPARVEPTTSWKPAVSPVALSPTVNKGLAWLAKHQQPGGGWAQGEESVFMGNNMDQVRDKANVADTSIAALALIRSGSTPKSGRYAPNVLKAVQFICGQVEESPNTGLSITSLHGTRVQMKLGQNIDTFLASQVLAEVKGQMPDARQERRAAAAFHKVMDKIEKNQNVDGTWGQQGWAPVLAQSMATKAMNRAAQQGYAVSEGTRLKADRYARGQFTPGAGAGGGAFSSDGSAGVQLYSAAGNLGGMQASVNTDVLRESAARKALSQARTPQDRAKADSELKRIAAGRKALHSATQAVTARLKDPQFVSGFGSNGGEEFLSYMQIGESLVLKGGSEWTNWRSSMAQNLGRIQNDDGSWSGHHCITGRTFCTAAATMVLTVDRAPAPVGQKLPKR